MNETPTPSCPECGSHDLRRIKWGYADLVPLTGDTVIFGGSRCPDGAPDSACLHCHPKWARIHQLAIEEERSQQKIEEFVAAAEFEPALQWKEQRDSVREELRNLLKALLDHTN